MARAGFMALSSRELDRHTSLTTAPQIRRHPRLSVATRQGPLLTLPSGTERARARAGNGERLLFGLSRYFVDAGLIFCQAGMPGQVSRSAAELAWPGNPDMPHMPESDVTFDTRWAGPGTARVNEMVGPVIPTI
jgi:hypothetical protein